MKRSCCNFVHVVPDLHRKNTGNMHRASQQTPPLSPLLLSAVWCSFRNLKYFFISVNCCTWTQTYPMTVFDYFDINVYFSCVLMHDPNPYVFWHKQTCCNSVHLCALSQCPWPKNAAFFLDAHCLTWHCCTSSQLSSTVVLKPIQWLKRNLLRYKYLDL